MDTGTTVANNVGNIVSLLHQNNHVVFVLLHLIFIFEMIESSIKCIKYFSALSLKPCSILYDFPGVILRLLYYVIRHRHCTRAPTATLKRLYKWNKQSNNTEIKPQQKVWNGIFWKSYFSGIIWK